MNHNELLQLQVIYTRLENTIGGIDLAPAFLALDELLQLIRQANSSVSAVAPPTQSESSDSRHPFENF